MKLLIAFSLYLFLLVLVAIPSIISYLITRSVKTFILVFVLTLLLGSPILLLVVMDGITVFFESHFLEMLAQAIAVCAVPLYIAGFILGYLLLKAIVRRIVIKKLKERNLIP